MSYHSEPYALNWQINEVKMQSMVTFPWIDHVVAYA